MAERKKETTRLAQKILETTVGKKASERDYKTEDDIDEAIEDAWDDLDEKIEKRKKERAIAEGRKELKKIERLSALLDYDSKEEALKNAETDEEKEFINKNF